MQEKAIQEEMTILDAVDNLSSIAELDLAPSAEEEGIKASLHAFSRLSNAEKEKTLAAVKKTFETVHQYLTQIYQKNQLQLEEADLQNRIKGIILLADEAVKKINTCSDFFQYTFNEGKIVEIAEYRNLKNFYSSKIVTLFRKAMPLGEPWEEHWGVEEPSLRDVEKLKLRDLNTVKQDRAYELFYIRQDDGKPFFSRNLLRHLKLVSDFEEAIDILAGKDPLMLLPLIRDNEAQKGAEEIKGIVSEEMAHFYIDALKYKELPIIRAMNNTIMSLLLAANPRNLIQTRGGKVCFHYFYDFQFHLRKLLCTPEYENLLSLSLEQMEELSRGVLHLIYALSFAFFTHPHFGEEVRNFIDDLIQWEEAKKEQKEESFDFSFVLRDLFSDYDVMQNVLKKYPSGPIFRSLDILQERGENEGFDPLFQGNIPSYLYTFLSKAFDSTCLYLPCPTFHEHINKAKIVDEFKAYLHFLGWGKEAKKHLLVNLQDRNSWQEHARCFALEELEKDAKFKNQFVLLSLPKKGDFFDQSEEYRDIEKTEDFVRVIHKQVESGWECGFSFPDVIPKKALRQFVNQVLSLIHTYFFSSNKVLSRKERQDFIEIFYLFLFMKFFELVKPDYFSFTCKDGVDVSASTNAAFFSLLQMLSGSVKWNEKKQKFLMQLLFGPALLMRERLPDLNIFSRTLSSLIVLQEGFEKHYKEIMQELELLFEKSFLQEIQMQWE